MNKRIVLTGGPGSGKTSVIEFLNSLGYYSAPEVGRKVIQLEIKLNSDALPWDNKAAFRDKMLLEEINNYKIYNYSTFCFYDRSIIDCYGYSKLENIPISENLIKNCHELTYNSNVFIFPPWKSIYKNDLERKQDYKESVSTYNEMLCAYKYFGYKLIEVPKVSVEKRVEFILNKVNNM
ncbi:ATP-binding protein [Malaciobacter molluscorum]|uniref:AAA family ATPase n=1 Tax=Malaciobacter molluscorum TaxID=1032072 RepID=UPI00100AEEF0|nr:AAA family ATPase [Malaciobacter molluscorum]RXJ94865.1 ATP-binding protein [Malaciobacter molluscorum]